MSASPEKEPAAIGVVHLNQLGDLMFSLPVLAALRAAFPSSLLMSVLSEPLEPLLLPGNLIDGVLPHRGSRDFFASLGRVRAADLDLVVCLSQSPRSRLLAFASGAPRRVGFGGGPMASLLTESIDKTGMPSTANNLRLVRDAGWPTPYETYQGLLKAASEDRAAARALLEAHGWNGQDALLVASPAASRGRESKEWPGERFMEVGRAAAELGVCSVVVGSAGRQGIEHLPEAGVLDLTGRTSLRDLMGLVELAELFVGIDSGVMHLAAALGTPCVALFGPTDPDQTGPLGDGHTIVQSSADGPGSMDAITSDRVFGAIEEALGRSVTNRGRPIG